MNLRLIAAAEHIGNLSGIDEHDVYASIGANTIHWTDDEEESWL